MSVENILLFGCDAVPAPPRDLRAGPFTLRYEAGDLRYVTLENREVIRRIYAAVRDQNWATIPGQIHDEELAASESRFFIRYRSEHKQGHIHFVWEASITGEADGRIRFVFDGEAKTTFLRNRIGLCVLHPIRECAGARCLARYIDGRERVLTFPSIIAAEQPVEGLEDLAGLAHEVAPGVWAELRFDGDVFETEDQRNWIDASFKTYCTPLRLPHPAEIRGSTRVRQSVELTLVRADDAEVPPLRSRKARSGGTTEFVDLAQSSPGQLGEIQTEVLVALNENELRPLPELGLAVPRHGIAPTDQEIVRLRRLKLNHLRIDLRFSDESWEQHLQDAISLADKLGVQIEAALTLSAATEADLDEFVEVLTGTRGLSDQLHTRLTIFRRILILSDGELTTLPKTLAACRSSLRQRGIDPHQLPLGAGTHGDLYQLNLKRPPADADFIGWSMNPQVHAFDNTSLMETPEAAAQQVTSVQSYFPGAPVIVSPITLKPGFDPVAAGPEPPVLPGELPPQVDPRQMSLVGAAWTLAMLASLLPSGVQSLTLFETSGWCGVMETARGSLVPTRFPSRPGQVFPVWHVLVGLAGFTHVASCPAGSPLRISALLLTGGHERRRLILANLTAEPTRARIACGGLLEGRRLHSSNALVATTDPEAFCDAPFEQLENPLVLPPYAIAFLDLA